MPSTWEFAKFGDVIEIVGGSQPPKSDFMDEPEGDCVRLIQIRDYKSDKNIVYIPREKAKRFVTKDEVMIGRYGPPIFQILRGLEGAYNVALMKAKPREGVFSNEYLYRYLSNQELYNYVDSASDRTAGQSGVNKKHLEQYPVGVPPLAEQTRIVEKLDEVLAQVDTIKARLDGIPAILKRFRQSVLAAAVSGKLTEEWRGGSCFVAKEYTLQDLTHMDIGHAFKSKEFSETGIPLLRGQNIEPGALRWVDTKFFPEDKLTSHRKLFIEEGDIILAMDRPIVSAGLKLARAKKSDLPCVLVQRVARIRTNDLAIDDYIYLLLKDASFSDYLVPNQTGSDIPHISGKQIQAYQIAIPALEEQKEIVRLVDQYFAFADTIEAQVKKAQARVDKLTQSILAKAFRGELVPQDPNDEPADKLLERIALARKEAEVLAKAAKKAAKK
ncbi:restriction endonuclease subunit S [Vibrio cholerae]|nr:restriction endonuclease subunit S [Vibrio cholerae]EKF9914993.1 restriction endonuclease subunit S [Vibrio cholerae]EKF9924514.1 restriction endonuclease subunit S [Vibrio cholerae]EKG0028337.1 restriction endonuclease subunit S [Vibrio cholerae]